MALDALLTRDRALIASALVAICLLAWGYLLWLAADMRMGGASMVGMRMIPAGVGWMAPASAPWSGIELLLVLAMWVVMMVGMMTPSAAPMILIYARVGRHAAEQRKPFAATGWFAGGYLLAWTAFSVLATLCQWGLERATLLTPAMALVSRGVGAGLLIAAGIYQWLSVKQACLRHCQSPFAFISRHGGFRRDRSGALWLGAVHGAYCVGCCWMLMVLLFAVGIMNVLWIAGLSALALLERVVPRGDHIARIAGAALFAAGVWLLLQTGS
jgi:predicted metal-binding membrane protein